MREIRLRGKLNGEWVVGGIVATLRPAFVCIKDDWWAYLSGGDNEQVQAVCHPTESTGLHDRNGKEIFEGDILEYWDAETNAETMTSRLVKHCGSVNRHEDGYWMIDDQYMAYYLHQDVGELRNNLGIKGDRDSNGVLLADCTGVKVVGNVFDNPELLTEKKKDDE